MLTPKQKSKKAHLALQALLSEAEKIGLTRDKYYFECIPHVIVKMLKSKRTYDSKMTMCYYKFVDSPIITATIAICSRKDDPIHNNGRYRALERLYRYYKEYPHEMEPITRDMISNINITDDTKVIINCAFGPDLKSLYFDDGNLNDYDLVKNFVML